MLKYCVKRLLQSLITVLLIVSIVFLLMRLLPTDYYFREDELMKFTDEQKNERLEAEGKDFVYMVQENTVTGQGFPTMAAAEKAMAEQILKEMNIEIGGGGCCCCGPAE